MIPFDAVVEEFSSRGTQLARRDRTALDVSVSGDGDCQVPVAHVRREFAAYPSLITDDGDTKIPLHLPDSAELTGEYLLYSDSSIYPAYGYFDTTREKRARVAADRIEQTAFAWQLRFFTSAFDPPEETSYLSDEYGTQSKSPSVVHPESEFDSTGAEAFYDELADVVASQREAERAEKRETFERVDFDGYRRSHGGIPVGIPVRCVDTDEGTYCTVLVPEESIEASVSRDFGVYPDNEVLIEVESHGAVTVTERQKRELPLEGVVRSVEGNTVQFELFSDRNGGEAERLLRSVVQDGKGVIRLAGLHNPVPYDRLQQGIRTTRRMHEKRALLTGSDPILFDPASVATEFPSLNEYQTAAATRALAAERCLCIHGPPGTGKTRTLVAIIKQLVDDGNRVLACAHSNQATDNLLVGTSSEDHVDPNSLHAGARKGELSIGRAGSGTKNPVVASEYDNRSFVNVDIVGATMSAAAQFDSNHFDVAVIDEGSQASIQASLIPVTVAKTTILAGDHKQLPPYNSRDLEDRELELSLFEHLIDRYGTELTTMLSRQYRMHERIAAFPNQEFYDGKLETAEPNRHWQIGNLDPVTAYQVDGTERSARGHSWKNDRERQVVTQEVRRLCAEDIAPSEIGVITPYHGQVDAIRSALGDSDVEARGTKVDTIDSFQGGEREAIIVSFVRSNDAGNTGFLTAPNIGPRRLNVALTRARKRLVLVGNWETLTTPSAVDYYSRLYEWLQSRDLIQHPSSGSQSPK